MRIQNKLTLTWRAFVAGAAAVLAGFAATRGNWRSAALEGAMCVFFFIREAQEQRARRRLNAMDPQS